MEVRSLSYWDAEECFRGMHFCRFFLSILPVLRWLRASGLGWGTIVVWTARVVLRLEIAETVLAFGGSSRYLPWRRCVLDRNDPVVCRTSFVISQYTRFRFHDRLLRYLSFFIKLLRTKGSLEMFRFQVSCTVNRCSCIR